MKGERFLAFSSASIGTLNAGPPTSTRAREKAGAWPQLTIPAPAPLDPITTASTVRPPESSISSEIKVGPTGNTLAVTCSPRVSAVSPASSSTMVPNGSIRSRASPAKGESRRLPANASSARSSSAVVVAAIFSRSLRANNARGRELLHLAVDGLDAGSAADQQAVGDEPERGYVDQASALVDQIGEDAVDVGIFAGAVIAMLIAVQDQLGATVLEANGGPFDGLDRDRPFFALAPAPVEAGVEGAVGLGTRKDDIGGDRRLRVIRHFELS